MRDQSFARIVLYKVSSAIVSRSFYELFTKNDRRFFDTRHRAARCPAESRRQQAESRRHKAESSRQKAVGGKQWLGRPFHVASYSGMARGSPPTGAQPSRFHLLQARTLALQSTCLPTAYCPLPSAYCFLPTDLRDLRARSATIGLTPTTHACARLNFAAF